MKNLTWADAIFEVSAAKKASPMTKKATKSMAPKTSPLADTLNKLHNEIKSKIDAHIKCHGQLCDFHQKQATMAEKRKDSALANHHYKQIEKLNKKARNLANHANGLLPDDGEGDWEGGGNW